MFEMKLVQPAQHLWVLPESTDSLKISYLSRESTYRLVVVDFVCGGRGGRRSRVLSRGDVSGAVLFVVHDVTRLIDTAILNT